MRSPWRSGARSLAVPSLEVRLDNVYGIIAFVITRGVDGILLLLPMTTGVLLGRGLGRRLVGTTRSSRRPPVGTVLVGAMTVALVVLVASPASTPPVGDPGGAIIPGSIAELARVRLGGADQSVMIRGASTDKPVLLYLSGGPGQSDLPLARVLSAGWTNDFVFVDLDQRGNGKSYAAIDPLSDMTIDRAVSDVIELTDYLRERFDEEKIYLMGESWGSILGVLAVQRRPDLYHAWIGSGQMVDVLETDRRIYRDLVAYATRAGDADLLASLAAVGEPPYRDIPWANSNLLAWYEYLYKPYTPSAGYIARGDASGLDPFGVLGSEYTFLEKRERAARAHRHLHRPLPAALRPRLPRVVRAARACPSTSSTARPSLRAGATSRSSGSRCWKHPRNSSCPSTAPRTRSRSSRRTRCSR